MFWVGVGLNHYPIWSMVMGGHTPGGADSVLLLEDTVSAFLLEDGSSYIKLE